MTRSPRLALAALGLAGSGFLGLAISDRLHGEAPPPAIVQTMPKELASYRDLVKQVLPAVVSIETRAAAKRLPNATRAPNMQLPPGMPEEFRKFFESGPMPPGAQPMPHDGAIGSGSGVIVDAAGVVLTNFHVVDGADVVEVTLHDGRKFTATDIRRDPKTDLAVLRITADTPLPHLQFADSDACEVGDRVLAVGAPFGLASSVTHGIISAKGRSNMHINQYEDFLQTDAAINPGNSGGPLIGLDGRIVGINSAIKSRSGGSQGIGFAISSNMAREISGQLLAHGNVKRGYLGVGIRDLDLKVAERLGAKSGGVLVTKVYENTPAAKAGLRNGDVILALGGVAVKDAAALPRVVAKLPLGKPAEIRFLHDGQLATKTVTIEEQPQDYGLERATMQGQPPAAKSSGLAIGAGITVVPANDAAAAPFGYSPGTEGVVVSAVEPGSPAAAAGLARGLMIRKIDGTAVATPEAARKALEAMSGEKGALLQVARPTGEVEYMLLNAK